MIIAVAFLCNSSPDSHIGVIDTSKLQEPLRSKVEAGAVNGGLDITYEEDEEMDGVNYWVTPPCAIDAVMRIWTD